MKGQPFPVDVLGVLESTSPVLVLKGEHHARTAGKREVAVTRCKITFTSEDKLLACIQALKESDDRVKAMPAEKVMYEWKDVFRDGLVIYFGVSWYDKAFFEARKNAYESKHHASIFDRFGISAEHFVVAHELVE